MGDGLDVFGGAAKWVDFAVRADPRGALVAFEHSGWRFMPQRSFLVQDVPVGVSRGGHAHRECAQVLVCLSGRVEVEIRTHDAQATLSLSDPARGLHLDAGVWARQTYVEEGTRLLVFASQPFDPASYLPLPPVGLEAAE